MFSDLKEAIQNEFTVQKKYNLSKLYNFLFDYFDLEGGIEQEEMLYLVIFTLSTNPEEKIIEVEKSLFSADTFKLIN